MIFSFPTEWKVKKIMFQITNQLIVVQTPTNRYIFAHMFTHIFPSIFPFNEAPVL
jgi:hypothetical protein